MHGIIHAELKKFVEAVHGPQAYQAVLREAKLEGKIFLATMTYPDSDATAMVTAASKLTGTPPEAILEAFGEFIAPDLLKMFQALIKPSWKTIEMLLNTEETIHKVVRMKNPGAQPPRLHFVQTGPRSLDFFYDSPRQMAAVAKGIMRGVAKHFGESIQITEKKGPGGKSEMKIVVA